MKFSKIVPIRSSWLVQKFLIPLIIFGFSLNAQDIQEKISINDPNQQIKQIDCLQIFKNDLNKYKPNAPWITESYMSMNLKQFSCAFKKVIKILTVPQKRWFYFSDNSQGFNPDNFWAECLWQCVRYEEWMSKLSFSDFTLESLKKIKANALNFDNLDHTIQDKIQLAYKDASNTRIPFIKILTDIEQLKLGKNLVNKYYQFYAFYNDCLSNFFCQSVYSCYSALDDQASYKKYLEGAKEILKKMKQNLQILKKSKLFYPSYKMTLDSYKNILALLEAEKIKTYLGSRYG